MYQEKKTVFQQKKIKKIIKYFAGKSFCVFEGLICDTTKTLKHNKTFVRNFFYYFFGQSS